MIDLGDDFFWPSAHFVSGSHLFGVCVARRAQENYIFWEMGSWCLRLLRSLPLLREGGKDISEFQLHMQPTFCFPCRFTDINVIPCRPLPPSDALVTTNGLSSDRIRLVATGAPVPRLKFMLLERHVRPKADLKVFGDVCALLSRRASRCKGVTICCSVTVFQIAATTICWRWFKKCLKNQHKTSS